MMYVNSLLLDIKEKRFLCRVFYSVYFNVLYCDGMSIKENDRLINICSFYNLKLYLFKICRLESDAFALRFKRRGSLAMEGRSDAYTTQKPNLLTGGTDKLFLGPQQGAVADVIEPLNRDYPRVIGCGDTLHCFHLGLSLQLLLPLHTYNRISF